MIIITEFEIEYASARYNGPRIGKFRIEADGDDLAMLVDIFDRQSGRGSIVRSPELPSAAKALPLGVVDAEFMDEE